MDKLKIILLGPPGSGKGTQAKRLSQDYQLPHVSTGDLFREHIEEQTLTGKEAKNFIEAGQLVPDALVLAMAFDRLSRLDCQRGYVLDGFPRTLAQADQLTALQKNTKKLYVLALEVSDEVIVKRAAGRLVCQLCGTIYNQFLTPPLQEGICDKCQGVICRRKDDEAEVVRQRLQVYHKQTQPLIDYYIQLGVLTVFEGAQSPDEVHKNLKFFIDQQS